ncbi:MAG: PEP-CTERM sorting domain-containing protein [bacterium]|nr:PEP-CTERM sorting domain-containing protein [bacterium]
MRLLVLAMSVAFALAISQAHATPLNFSGSFSIDDVGGFSTPLDIVVGDIFLFNMTIEDSTLDSEYAGPVSFINAITQFSLTASTTNQGSFDPRSLVVDEGNISNDGQFLVFDLYFDPTGLYFLGINLPDVLTWNQEPGAFYSLSDSLSTPIDTAFCVGCGTSIDWHFHDGGRALGRLTAFSGGVLVPEPSSAVLLLLGLAGLSFVRSRHRA